METLPGDETKRAMGKGDQIYVWRSLAGLHEAYEHHGIDCGDRTVIHYSKRGEIPTIRRSALSEFMGDTTRPGQVNIKPYTTAYIPATVVQRAESRLGEQQYNLVFNNCEHFATWCKTGVNRSAQIADWMPFADRLDPGVLEQALGEGAGLAMEGDRGIPASLNRALDDIQRVWDRLQPQHKQAKQAFTQWDLVAQVAIQRGRDDLARGAIAKKLKAKKEAQSLTDQLSQLATLTEKLVRQGQAMGIDLKARRS